jgi:hypothetical protein
MHFCTPVAVNPWIVFHIVTCGGTRFRDGNSPILRLKHDVGNRRKKSNSAVIVVILSWGLTIEQADAASPLSSCIGQCFDKKALLMITTPNRCSAKLALKASAEAPRRDRPAQVTCELEAGDVTLRLPLVNPSRGLAPMHLAG